MDAHLIPFEQIPETIRQAYERWTTDRDAQVIKDRHIGGNLASEAFTVYDRLCQTHGLDTYQTTAIIADATGV